MTAAIVQSALRFVLLEAAVSFVVPEPKPIGEGRERTLQLCPLGLEGPQLAEFLEGCISDVGSMTNPAFGRGRIVSWAA